MPLDDPTRLRGLLGERIPTGGTAGDTLFTEEEVQDFLDRAGGNLGAAAWLGWRDKASDYANLVTVNEGNSARNLSDLAAAAAARLKEYLPDAVAAGVAAPETAGRVKIGIIQRSGGSIE